MARTKQKARRGAKKSKDDAEKQAEAGPSSTPDAQSLIEKAHILLGQSNFELAIKFLNRALSLEQDNAEARELVGIAELEGGDADVGREHLLHLFPPHAVEPPSSPSPYLYLAQSAADPHEALGYYSTAASMLEKTLSTQGKGKSKGMGDEEDGEEERQMAVTALVAMIEIWMSDLCFEPAAEGNCDSLISRALSISPQDIDVRISLASIRMSQQRFDEAKEVAMQLFEEIDEKEPFDATMPPLPTRLTLIRLLLEHSLHLPALSLLATAREEDSLEVESAYLEGWAWHLRGEAIEQDATLLKPVVPPQEGEEDDNGPETIPAQECFEESMRALIECGKLFADQDYPDEGIGAHVQELLAGLQARGVTPAVADEPAEIDGAEAGADWEDVEMA